MRLHLLMALLALLPLQAPPPAQNPVSSLKDGVIEVTVRDSATKSPIPGARITFIFQQSPPPNIVTYVNADQSGHATFRDLAMGTYAVNAQRDGYIDNIQATFRQPVIINADKKTFSVDVTLTRGATLAGHILDPNGVPIARAGVTLATLSYRNGKPTIARVPTAGSSQTDDRGEYRLIGLAPGDYYVQVELRRSLEQLQTGVWDDFPRTTFYPGVVDPKRAVKVTIGGSQDVASIDLKIPAVTSFKLSGTVINPFPGGTATNVRFPRTVSSYYLGSADPEGLEDPILLESSLTPSRNPDESIFEITGVMPGSYFLYPLLNTNTGLDSYVTSRTPVTVMDHDVDGLRIVLKPNSEIKGRIVVDGNVAAVPLNMVRVSLRPRDRIPTLLGGVGLGLSATADPNTGEFTLTNVPDARFGVMVASLPPSAYVSDVRQAGRSVFNDGMIPDSTQPLEVEIRTNAASIQGVVRNAAGEPALRSAVVLIPSATGRQNSQLYKRATSDMNGEFRLTGIAPGQYKLFAWTTPPAGQAEENADYISQFENRGTLVNVMAGASMPVSLTVIPLP